jgi:ribokinase
MAKIKKKKFDIITVGGATRDFMFYSGEGELISTGNLTKQKLLAFEYGAKITADKMYVTYGGGATNTATSFSKLGLKTAVVTRIGKDEEGKNILANLSSRKVDTSLVKIDKKESSAFSMVLTVNKSSKEHIVFTHRGASDQLSATDLPLKKVNANWFYISSLPKLGWDKVIDSIISTEANIAWNPGSRQLNRISRLKKYLPKVKILVLNRDEASEFKKLKNIKGLIKHIFDLGPEIVVITDGSKGAYVYDGSKYYFMKPVKHTNKDTVGVGDAFASAFTAAIFYGKSIKTALKWGITNAGSVVGKVGAQNGQLSKRQINK